MMERFEDYATNFDMNAETQSADSLYPFGQYYTPPPELYSKDEKSDDQKVEEERIYPLGREIYVQPSLFQGQMRVDIRQWDNEGRRTKKGISLPIPCWLTLLGLTKTIQQTLDRIKGKETVREFFQLTNNVFVTLQSPLWIVDIRYWYKSEDGTLKPGWRGISLRLNEYSKLIHCASTIEQDLDSLLQNV